MQTLAPSARHDEEEREHAAYRAVGVSQSVVLPSVDGHEHGGCPRNAHAGSARAHTLLCWRTQELFFLENARRWADALRDADVVMNERARSHGGAFWREEFPLMVA
jgi:hypothetical protein